jgi:diadenylate cyclase
VTFFTEIFSAFRFPQDALDIIIVAVVFYNLFLLIRGTRAIQMLVGILVLLVVYFAAVKIGLHALSWILQNFLGAAVLVVIILFQPELRRVLANVGRAPLLRFFSAVKEEQVLQEIVKGVTALSSRRVGALIAIQRESDLLNHIEGGVTIDARLSKELLFSIFLPASPIHDGAVLVQVNRIVQAGCLLPLSEHLVLPKELATRHRAAVGLTEETDAVVIVVSEETGTVSMAVEGRLHRGLEPADLSRRLEEIFGETGGKGKGP